MVEGLLLLNFARSADYCSRHDIMVCECEQRMGQDNGDEYPATATTDKAEHGREAMKDVAHLHQLRAEPLFRLLPEVDDVAEPSWHSADEVQDDWEEQTAMRDAAQEEEEETTLTMTQAPKQSLGL